MGIFFATNQYSIILNTVDRSHKFCKGKKVGKSWNFLKIRREAKKSGKKWEKVWYSN